MQLQLRHIEKLMIGLFLPLAIDHFVQNGVDHVVVETSVAVDDGQGRMSQEAEEVQIIGSAEDDI